MAGINTFPCSCLNYPDINIKTFSQGVKDIFRLAQVKTAGAEALQEKALRVSFYSQRLDIIVRESLSTLQAKLKNTLALTYFTNLDEIDETLISHDIDEESKTEMCKERVNLINSLGNDIAQLKKLFIEKTELLDKSASSLHNVVIIGGIDAILQTEKLRRKQLTKDITAKKLNNQMDIASPRLTELNRQLEQSEKLISGVNVIIKITQEKSAVVAEAEKLSRAWHQFINEMTALQGTVVSEVGLSKPLLKQLSYLESLIKQFTQR